MKLSVPEVLTQDELEAIHEASLNILAEVGMVVDEKELLHLLAEAGTEVDFQTGLVKIPRELTQQALRTAPSEVALLSRDGQSAINLGDGKSYAATGFDAVFFEDTVQGERRPARKEDVGHLFRIADALERYALLCPPALPQDVPPRLSYAHAADAAFNNSGKHLLMAVDSRETIETLLRMAQVVADTSDLNHKPIVSFQVSIESPLYWPEHVSGPVLAIVRAGVPILFHAAPLSGSSGPITLAGQLAEHNAVILSGVVVSQIIREGSPVIYGGGQGTFDLRAMTRVLGCPEAALLMVAGGQIGRFYGIPCHSLGLDTDSHVHDEQNGWEKMLTAIFSLISGIDLVVNSSMYGTAMAVSAEQLLIDHEILEICYRLLEGIEVNPETIAFDVIKSVGPRGNFLMEEHTLRYLRTGEHWPPKLSNRYGYDKWLGAGGRDVVQRAAQRAQEILKSHEPEPLEAQVRRELERILSAS
jgi:trimethylamine--corrinoid protein Co-methyltransferase